MDRPPDPLGHPCRAGITMTASAANTALTHGALGDNRLLGLATGIAADIGLCVALLALAVIFTELARNLTGERRQRVLIIEKLRSGQSELGAVDV